MSGSDFKNKLGLFDDALLPVELRAALLSAVVADEMKTNSLQETPHDSPQKKLLLTRAAYIEDKLKCTSSPQKKHLIGELAKQYCIAKEKKVPSLSINTSTQGVTAVSNPLPAGAGQVKSFLLPGLEALEETQKQPGRSPSSWAELPVVSEYDNWLLAEQGIGPFYYLVKSSGQLIQHFNTKLDVDTREFRCSVKNCTSQVRLTGPKQSYNERTSGPVTLSVLGQCTHASKTWLDYYEADRDENGRKHKKGLPPFVKYMVDTLARTQKGPQVVLREVEQMFRTESFFANHDVRKCLLKQMRSRVQYVRKNPRAHLKRNDPIKWTNDLLNFKAKHRFQVPEWYIPMEVCSEEHLVELASLLESRGALNGKKYQEKVPHRDLIVLDYDDRTEVPRIGQLSDKRPEAAKEHTMVFTSLALLRAICDAKKLDWRVVGSVDGAANTTSNDYVLLACGVFSITEDGHMSFVPYFYVWGPGEREEISSIGLHCFRKISWELFRLVPRFLGGFISDHTEVFTNSFAYIFPDDAAQRRQCYTHIIRKFIVDQKRAGNGKYRSHLQTHPPKWLQLVAKLDVDMQHGSRSEQMQKKMYELCNEAWCAAGEPEVARVYSESYRNTSKPHFMLPRYNASGIPGCVTHNQANERNTLDIKGSAHFEGAMAIGRSPTKMINEEFPKLIYINSTERSRVKRCYPILSPEKTLTEDLFEYHEYFDQAVDFAPYVTGFLVNVAGFLGLPINQRRVQDYENTLNGIYEGGHRTRRDFYEHVAGLCHVQLQELEEDVPAFYTGSCRDFFNNLNCHHCAVFQYKEELRVNNRIPTNKRGRIKQKMVGAAMLYRNRQTVQLLNSVNVDEIVETTLSQLLHIE